MGLIRMILIALYLPFFFLGGNILRAYGRITWKKDEKRQDRAVYRYTKWGLGCIWALCGCETIVTGIENIPGDRSVLFVGNHRSIFDVAAVGAYIPNGVGFIAKNSLEKIPVLSGWMRAMHCLFLNRTDIRQGMQTILSAIELVKNGTSLFIFPEGTRNRTEEPLLDFHGGSFKIALKAGVPVIPVTINGMEELFENHMPFIRPQKVTVAFGTPIETAGLSREEIREIPARAEKEIRDTYLQNC